MAKKKLSGPECPSCTSSQVLYAKKRDSFWCRVCGHEWEKSKINGNKVKKGGSK